MIGRIPNRRTLLDITTVNPRYDKERSVIVVIITVCGSNPTASNYKNKRKFCHFLGFTSGGHRKCALPKSSFHDGFDFKVLLCLLLKSPCGDSIDNGGDFGLMRLFYLIYFNNNLGI
jgi:hypothetical protein